ncbi:hypothetical protein TUM4261_35850 [Shewanella sp. c952]|uniref:DUF2835 domain-containing protein n=1 Tax=Shewanella sp. c952 TaxID=2815913 RepID=UPI001BBCEFA9|nr:DUF2835 domain-containing protein [Shewanella sp. c952]GIU16879.1 hypothetical protein TUM4261_35850 [Shewanella sp. c952]
MQQSNQVFLFPLNISYEDFLPYYRGQVTKVEVVDSTGRTLWISARHFRPFFTRSGIKAYFKMVVDAQGNLIQLNRV